MSFGPDTLDLLGQILPQDDGSLPSAGELRRAAVLVPLFVREDCVHVVLTKRADTLRTHTGQVSFPGGSWESQDATLRDTALREAHEEVGLEPADVQILGVLDDTPTNVTGFLVRPFVATIPHPYQFVHDLAEVDHVFSPALEIFADPSRRREEIRERDGRQYPVWFYDVDGDIVWGATARMLVMLVEKIIAARA